MNDEKVSVVITTKNRLSLLKRAVESVYGQTYNNLELIVVDDASEDGTLQWAEKQNFKYIYIEKEDSHGGNYARNLGIKNTTGEYVAFLDDDDYWESDKLKKQVDLLIEKKCGMVYCGRRVEYIDSHGTNLDTVWLPNINNQGDVHRRILYEIMCSTSTILVKRSLLFEIGLFDENLRFWQEYELDIRLAQITEFYFVNEPLCIYRLDKTDKNRLSNKYHEWEKAVNYIYSKHSKLYSRQSIIERYLKKILYLGDAVNRTVSDDLRIIHAAIYIRWWIMIFPYRIIHKIQKSVR